MQMERSRRRVKRTTSDDALGSVSQSDMRKLMEKQKKAGSLRNITGSSSRLSRRSSRKNQVDDYDVALAKVRARFDVGGRLDSNERGSETAESSSEQERISQRTVGSVPKNYEDGKNSSQSPSVAYQIPLLCSSSKSCSKVQLVQQQRH